MIIPNIYFYVFMLSGVKVRSEGLCEVKYKRRFEPSSDFACNNKPY